MTHWRQTLRETAKALLVAAPTAAGLRVYANRIAKLDCRKETFPILAVYAKSDDLTRKAQGSSWDGSGSVIVAAFVKGAKTETLTAEEVAGAALDALCDQVESVLLGDGRWEAGASVTATRLGTEVEMYDAEELVFMAKLTITVDVDATIAPFAPITAPLAKVTLATDNSPADGNVTLPVDPEALPEGVDTYDEIEPEQET